MRILRKKQVGHQPQTRIEKRVATLSTPDLLSWMEQSMYTIGKLVTTWQKSPNEALIDEVVMGTEVFHAIAKELKQRTKSML
jgi:hypothetical protein